MLGFGALGEFALGEGPTEGQPFNTPFLPLAKAGQRQFSTPPGIGLNPNLQRNNFPNNQYDWPAPHRIRRSPVVLDGPFNPNLFKNPVPIFNHFESSFRVADFIPPSNPYNQNLYTVAIVSVPFNQTDWARPFRIRSAAVDQSVSLNPNIYTNPFPFFNVGSPSNRIPILRPTDNLYNLSLYTVIIVSTPFNQTDWVKPTRLRGAFDQTQAFNPNLYTNPLPFTASTPAPAIRSNASSLSAGFNPNLSTVVVTTTPILNFASTIIYHFRITLPDNSIGFLITRPVTPPPTNQLIQRTLTGVGL